MRYRRDFYSKRRENVGYFKPYLFYLYKKNQIIILTRKYIVGFFCPSAFL